LQSHGNRRLLWDEDLRVQQAQIAIETGGSEPTGAHVEGAGHAWERLLKKQAPQ
jgi:hypothetical protein